MRLHLVSLALLLLALCRSSSAGLGYTVVSKNTKSTSSSVAFTTPAQSKTVTETASSVKAPVDDDAKKTEKIMELLGNTIFTLGFAKAGMIQELATNAPHFYLSLLNGVMCEFDRPDLNKDILDIQGDQRAKEMDTIGGADACTKTETDPDQKAVQKCFCDTPTNTLIYCTLFLLPQKLKDALQDKGIKKKTCRKDALENFKTAGKDLFKAYDLDNFGTDKYTEFFKGDVDSVSKTAAAMFCDALNSKVETAVRELYAADALYWIAESVVYSIVFGAPQKSLLDVCAEPDFANNEYGKCVCKFDTGFSFCIYKVFAQYFEKEKYLSCTPSAENPEIIVAAYVADKKPTAPPPKLAQRGSASPNSAATCSLLLAPLTAAAAMLLRL